MDKVVLQFEPKPNDYSYVIRSFLTYKRMYWVSLGIYSIGTLALLAVSVLSFWIDSLRFSLYLAVIFLMLLFLTSYPLWSGWLTVRNAPKKEHLTLPARYELDDDQVVVVNQLAETKYDWRVFSKAFDDGQYYFLSHSTNKNMLQFIPKRAFASPEQENAVRGMIIRHLGEIEDTQKGLTGWKLTVLTALLFSGLLLCVIAVVAIAAM